jgi:hypothetical protein
MEQPENEAAPEIAVTAVVQPANVPPVAAPGGVVVIAKVIGAELLVTVLPFLS